MIKVTRLNGEDFWLNPHLIEFMEDTPDTVVSLISGKKVVVREETEEVLKKIIEYRRSLGEGGSEIAPIRIRGEQ
ncbi:MAG TPA: flagellar protein FlbD [Firmicutes bacterium]|jgi:flagellar protein FlbD|nr:flagellar protein FlbD [Bacillota bacterium]